MSDPVEQFWDDLLSRQPAQIRRAWATLDDETRAAVLVHLKRMTSEPGWHPEQVKSAQAALDALDQ